MFCFALPRSSPSDLIVAGAYGHSRLGEWIFGGVTRELLTRSSGLLPVFALIETEETCNLRCGSNFRGMNRIEPVQDKKLCVTWRSSKAVSGAVTVSHIVVKGPGEHHRIKILSRYGPPTSSSLL